MRSRVELFEAIRRDHRREDLSTRQLAHRHHVHRRTVRAALASATPSPRKQRHTARRVFTRLIEEHHVVDLSY